MKQRVVLSAVALVVVTACGGAEGDAILTDEAADSSTKPTTEASDLETDTAAAETEAEAAVVAELMVDGVTVEFTEIRDASGVTSLAVAEFGSAGTVSALGRIESETPPTALEVFRALAPEGTEAPAKLVEAHSAQALALGREDTEAVLELGLAADAVVQKSAASCSSLIFPNSSTWGIFNKQSLDNKSGSQALYVGNSSTYRTSSWVTLGACNDGSTNISARVSYDMDGDSSGWFFTPWATLGPGGYLHYYPWRMNVGVRCGIGTCLQPTRYRVHGSGTGPYHLKTAELFEIIR